MFAAGDRRGGKGDEHRPPPKKLVSEGTRRMYRFRSETLDQIRSPLQALAELTVKYRSMEPNHPKRSELKAMIDRLRAEVAARRGKGSQPPPSA